MEKWSNDDNLMCAADWGTVTQWYTVAKISVAALDLVNKTKLLS